jgi:hypothetical protein
MDNIHKERHHELTKEIKRSYVLKFYAIKRISGIYLPLPFKKL